MDIKALLANETKHRSLPFWSWNDRLAEGEIRRQINAMNNTKNGGFFMHARGGLETEYLSEDWFDICAAAIDEAKKLGLEAWAYDENGWPSGFADGAVPSRGFEYQQKKLLTLVLENENVPENLVALFKITPDGYERTDKAEKGVTAFYLFVNKYYIDTFNPDSIKAFLSVTHDEYYKRFGDEFGKTVKGFFTDEPQFNNTQDFPWSHVFEREFSKRYGYSLTENIPALYFDFENSFAVRYDFWRMVGDLFRTSFLKQLYDWCEEHGCKQTGHIMGEVYIDSQLCAVADSMPCYEYFHVPGIDWLGRKLGHTTAAKQLGSVAAQLDKPTITESFALCGWDVSPNDLRLIAGWQFVNGISMICQHLEAYTLRGLRKRDYPAALFMQLPWYDKVYGTLNTYFSKLGALMTEGEEPAPLLVVFPIFSATIHFADGKHHSVSDEFNLLSDRLNDEHILHHYGSEVLMERYGSVEGATLTVGKRTYSKVLLPMMETICENTLNLLTQFAQSGGKLFATAVPAFVDGRRDARLEDFAKLCTIIDEKDMSVLHDGDMPSLTSNGRQMPGVHIAERRVGDEKYFYAINLDEENKEGVFSTEGEYTFSVFDIVTEEKTAIPCCTHNGLTEATLTFEKWEAKVILAEKTNADAALCKEEFITFDPCFDVKNATGNMLTLDTCEYSIDGGEWQEEKAVITLFEELLELRRPCKVSLRFNFFVEKMPRTLYLLTETPNQFKITVNGQAVSFNDCGFEIDSSFRKMDISHLVKEGGNTIVYNTDFYQSQKVYDVIFGENVHETERNKLTYDTEIESIYLFGDFGVRSLDEHTYGERRSIFTGRRFVITDRPTAVDMSAGDITMQGHVFFAGNITLSQKLCVKKQENVRYLVKLSALNAPAAELYVGGKAAGTFIFTPYCIDVTDLLQDGENEFTFVLYSGNRNMLGPHHRPQGEVYDVGPATFTAKHGWSDDTTLPAWTDNYSFVKFGFEFLEK